MAAATSYCHFQIDLLKHIGIWPADRATSSAAVRWLQNAVLSAQMVTLLLLSAALLLGALFSSDLKNVSSTVDMATLTLSAAYKAFYVRTRIRRFRSLVALAARTFKPAVRDRNGGAIIRMADECVRCSLYTVLLCLSGAFAMLLYAVVPLLENGAALAAAVNSTSAADRLRRIQFPLVTWIPFDVYWSPVYELVYAVQCFGLFAAANIYLINDSFFFMLVYTVCVQMKMLREMIRRAADAPVDYVERVGDEGAERSSSTASNAVGERKQSKIAPKEEATICSNDVESTNKSIIATQKMIQRRFEECIVFHRDLLSVIMTIEKLFKSMILADILHAIISLSFALNETGVTNSIYNRIKIYFFILICIIHQLGNSYYGQMLLDAQEMISTAMYNSQWYDANIQTKKYLILILARSNKLTILSGGKMYYLRFQSFILFMKTIFSYYMVLRQASSE